MSDKNKEAAFSSGSLQIKLEGAGIKDGTISAADLAYLADSVNRLLQTANKEVYGEDSKIEVRFCGSKNGSFITDFIIVGDVVQFALDNKDSAAACIIFLDLLFKLGRAAKTVNGGFIALLKWLKGEKPDKAEKIGRDIYVHKGDNYFITAPESFQLMNSSKMRAAAWKFASLTDKKGIESLSASIPHSQPIKLKKEDIKSFAVPEAKETELVNESERIAILEIISPNFDSNKNWLVSEGDKPFNATIEDMDFFNQVKNKERTFGKGDRIKCRICERQYSAVHGLKKETDILQVTGFIESRPSKQLTLFPES